MGEGVHACGQGFCMQASPVHAQPHGRGHLGASAKWERVYMPVDTASARRPRQCMPSHTAGAT
eukprot:1160446-Pelagomonas_calceolata.AAC.3